MIIDKIIVNNIIFNTSKHEDINNTFEIAYMLEEITPKSTKKQVHAKATGIIKDPLFYLKLEIECLISKANKTAFTKDLSSKEKKVLAELLYPYIKINTENIVNLSGVSHLNLPASPTQKLDT